MYIYKNVYIIKKKYITLYYNIMWGFPIKRN